MAEYNAVTDPEDTCKAYMALRAKLDFIRDISIEYFADGKTEDDRLKRFVELREILGPIHDNLRHLYTVNGGCPRGYYWCSVTQTCQKIGTLCE